jgi:hypothetical protein
VGIDGGGIPQSLLKKNLLWGGIQKILAADHVGDPCAMVVYHGGQMISIDIIPAEENEIA